MQAKELLKRIGSIKAPVVLDVRSNMEYRSGHIPGAVHAPNLKILFAMASLPTDKNTEIIITCEHGPRAQMAQGLLSMYGYKNTTLLNGHMSMWRRSGLKMEK